ncbi:PE-PGRS family protein PE_PGRS26-like isoform X3 [Phaenicophaeus curvirostris]|uniref:PE-PGRS family protein PE_PGRS26-like isoform X3 n=1 Tax=Phaenicophaeus curvirostris TaxID=33595 RepID=UPI0037F0ABD9
MAEPPGPWGLIPPSHFMLPPPSTSSVPRALEAELEAERGRSQVLRAELEALRGRGHALGAEKPLEEDPQRRLLGRWRREVFALLLQRAAWGETERALRTKVQALEAAVAAATRRESQGVPGGDLAPGGGDSGHRGLGDTEQPRHHRAPPAGGLGAAMVAAGPGRGQVAEVTRGTVAGGQRGPEDALGTSRRGHEGPPGATGRIPPAGEGARGEVPPSGDGTGTPPGRAALGSLVRRLQAVGATILGDIEDVGDTP